MCGIFAQVIPAGLQHPEELSRRLREANATRGPDARKSCCISLSQLDLEFFSSELRLRGKSPVVQPHKNDSGSILCWNGEIFAGLDVHVDENDGIKLFEQLHRLETNEQVRDLFAYIEGPYAFVFYNATTQQLFFSRDPLGRRSLLIHRPSATNPYFLLASVSAGSDPGYSFEELETGHIHRLDIALLNKADDIISSFDSCFSFIARSDSSSSPSSFPYAEPEKVNTSLHPNDLQPGDNLDIIPDWLETPVEGLISQLDHSVMLQIRDIPQDLSLKGQSRVAVLFSGGIDSTILALLADRHVLRDEPIDLLNVAFENPRKIQVQQKGNINPNKKKSTSKPVKSGSDQALLTSTQTQYMVPDRVTGLQEVEELRRLCPSRVWKFVEINVPYNESQAARHRVEGLMNPVRTVMDLSLALALYFASRGVGQVRSRPEDDPIPYMSPARVLINGLGSDELLGGYGRHRSAFNTGGWAAVVEEVCNIPKSLKLNLDIIYSFQLQLEIDRIPTRNLGRDDRVISSHGKETRHPFLSLDVVSFLAQLPVQYKMDPRLPLGVGDKMLLRLAARKLGLMEASQRKKRAMQFGSHSARMEGDEKGDKLLNGCK
ncbi:asparagine synthase-domain-containing protein [Lentinula aciculospora]|uniref:Asparagine synthase-domain-containing protein n=1 Tax=Lentinula aciculospora TaxID=153920 RepID=A0A9W9ANX3_9AGAR|nr:asparagine synthase-domain-containing protein [Lentinula aciculospora]